MTNSGEGGGMKMKQKSWRRRKPRFYRERDAEFTGCREAAGGTGGDVIWITFCSRCIDAVPQALEVGSQYKCKCRATAQTAAQGSRREQRGPKGHPTEAERKMGVKRMCW